MDEFYDLIYGMSLDEDEETDIIYAWETGDDTKLNTMLSNVKYRALRQGKLATKAICSLKAGK